MTETGLLIKKTRMEKGISQGILAKRLKVSAAFINKVESGRGLWPNERVAEICKVLGLRRDIFVYAITKDFERKLK